MFYKLAKCDENLKLSFKSFLCPPRPGVFFSANPPSAGNLRSHVSRRHAGKLSEFDKKRKNRPLRRTASSWQSTEVEESKKRYIQTVFSTQNVSKQPSAFVTKRQNDLDHALRLFLIDAMIPLSPVENQKFLDMMSIACPDLHIPF